LSFNGNSGPPINALGAHPIYGAGQSFIITRGSAGRLPWVTSFDAKVGVNFRMGKDSVLTAAVEGFNLFNSQRPLSVDENYTAGQVSPILGATQGTVPNQYGGLCTGAAASTCGTGNGSLPLPKVDPNSATGAAIRVGLPNQNGVLTSTVTNLTWGKATAYQPVRQFRFSIRITF
ncbi:MAG: hypothetical protein ACXU88_15485, partial [Myxococcaceae bacterium]